MKKTVLFAFLALNNCIIFAQTTTAASLVSCSPIFGTKAAKR